VIAKKRKDFRDSNAKENIDKLNQELLDIKSIMHENFDMILNRDKNLGKISQMSSDLKDNSKKFKRDAKKLRLSLWLQKYASFIAVGAMVLFIVYIKFYLF
jgi:vesicle transport protein SEC22